jgi:hypothetical protein
MDHFPEDPTASEVNEELASRRRKAEIREEMARRKQWDADHGPIEPEEAAEVILDGEFREDAGEISRDS